MTDKPVYPDASEVSASDGAVQMDGPDGVDVAITPEAAEETSERLENQAIKGARPAPPRQDDAPGEGLSVTSGAWLNPVAVSRLAKRARQ